MTKCKVIINYQEDVSEHAFSSPIILNKTIQCINDADGLDELCTKHRLRRSKKQKKKLNTKNNLCQSCDKYLADFPSKICAGCEAYQEHQS